MSALYDQGRHYDLLYREGGDDIDFIVGEARRSPAGPILELACGTGRYVVPLARAGHDVIGLDTSEAMLAEAKAKAEALGLAPRLLMGDMRGFSLDVRPALIFIAGNSLCHLLTNDDVAACLGAVRAHLDPGARFLVDVFVPDVTLLARPPDKRFPYGAYEHPDGGTVEITSSVRYDPLTQINHASLFRRHGDGEPTSFGELHLRMFFPQELRALLGHHGFVVEEAFGDHQRGPLLPTSRKQILICKCL